MARRDPSRQGIVFSMHSIKRCFTIAHAYGQRAEHHRRIAEREETAYGEEVGEIAAKLANHYSRANDNDKAVKYFQLASARAVASRLDVLERLLREEDKRQSPTPKRGDDQ